MSIESLAEQGKVLLPVAQLLISIRKTVILNKVDKVSTYSVRSLLPVY